MNSTDDNCLNTCLRSIKWYIVMLLKQHWCMEASELDLNMNYLSNLWLVLNSVGSLLELSDLSYDMRYLQTKCHDSLVYPHNIKDTKATQKFISLLILEQIIQDMTSFLTILIFEKLTRPSSVKFGVPSSINARSVKYIPRYGTQGGLQLQKDRNEVKNKS